MTTHRAMAHHNGKGTYLFDGCDRCEEHSKTLYDLDDGTIKWLAEMADILKFYWSPEDYEENDAVMPQVQRAHNLSMNERRAITKLRLYARITFRSGITEEAAG